MDRQRKLIMALSVLLGTGIGACATPSSDEGSPTLRGETTQQQQEAQRRLEQQNREERERLQARAPKEEGPPYTENQPIGGQKQAGPADFPQPAFPFVKGQLVQIEGAFYTVRDAEGKEVRVNVDKSTQIDGKFQVGDLVVVRRNLQGQALSMQKASGPLARSDSSASSGKGLGSQEQIIKDSQVTLSGARQAVRGEVLKLEGNQYLIKDGHGNEIRLPFNQNTRMLCGSEKGTVGGLLPAPSASDKPESKGQPQDLARTAEQPGTDVGPGTRAAAKDAANVSQCDFKKGELIEAEVSDMGVATFIKPAGRAQPGQALP
jgi:hypothetical protein